MSLSVEARRVSLLETLPGWQISAVGGRWYARHPEPSTGIYVTAPDPDELVLRVRALVIALAIPEGRAPTAPGLLTWPRVAAAQAVTPEPTPEPLPSLPATTRESARQLGYEGDPCTVCGAMTLVRNGACRKCVTCGETDGCS